MLSVGMKLIVSSFTVVRSQYVGDRVTTIRWFGRHSFRTNGPLPTMFSGRVQAVPLRASPPNFSTVGMCTGNHE